MMGKQHPEARLALWIDGVGGYLVCLDELVALGQAVPGTRVQVPILGDLSQRHATIRREGEGYIVDPLRRTRLAIGPIDAETLLREGDVVQLGAAVALRFGQPHPLSASARLDVLSGHQVQPAVDAVLLMADSCVLGPKTNSHVVCPGWSEEVVLFRQGQSIQCRTTGPLEVDGRRCKSPAPLGPNSRVAGHDFAFALEQI